MSETIDMCSRHKLFKWEFELDMISINGILWMEK